MQDGYFNWWVISYRLIAQWIGETRLMNKKSTGCESLIQKVWSKKILLLCLVRKRCFIDWGLGGELISAFEKDGEDGVLRFANDKLVSMMYEDGETPQQIRFADYAKWKKTVVSSNEKLQCLWCDDLLERKNCSERPPELFVETNQRMSELLDSLCFNGCIKGLRFAF